MPDSLLLTMTATKLKVRLYGDPCLRQKALPVKEIGPAERILIESMIETMHAEKGIGLAAPQVGINQQIFVVDIGNGPDAITNPKILKKKGSAVMEEGCLSIPGVNLNVKRPQEILLEYLDINNQTVQKPCQDLLARVVLHEIDHLHGKMIVDYASLPQKLKLRKQLKAIETQSKKIDGE